ncbi:TPA: imidazole glycerol phosphate synthase subunit HisH [Candidatus Azambacteria bacterium]|nr:imidazole glycerol phosphate synthase subunit HisH [Candidatus Azambacteria bacterium]
MITIIDYGMGNLRSVAKAFEKIGAQVRVSSSVEDLRNADRIVLPGQGAFGDGMKNLKTLGLIEPLYEEVMKKKKPFLGICLGLQMLARESSEGGIHKGLGFLQATVRRFQIDENSFKVPHMGWDDVIPKSNGILFKGIGEKPNFYFIHSYHMVCDDSDVVAATCDYGEVFTAAVEHDNIFGTQFHPEKSQKNGLQLLTNFIQC